MPRVLSLNARQAMNAQETGDTPITLVTISHADLEDPIRLSSDPTLRLAIDPLRYGTISNDEEYDFVLMAAELPDDKEDAPPSVSLSFVNVARDMASLFRAVTSPARIDLVQVMASAPDDPLITYLDLRAMNVTYDADRVVLEVGRDAMLNEPWPAHRMTQNRFPGLYR